MERAVEPRNGRWRESAESAVADLLRQAADGLWSSARFRAELRRHYEAQRFGSYSTWRRAVMEIVGTGMRDLPDFRQLPLFGGTDG
jgi:hypothetical protein